MKKFLVFGLILTIVRNSYGAAITHIEVNGSAATSTVTQATLNIQGATGSNIATPSTAGTTLTVDLSGLNTTQGNTNATNITTETTARTAADTTLTNNLATEVTNRTTAVAGVQTQITNNLTAQTAVNTAQTTTNTSLQNQITVNGTAITTLQGQVTTANTNIATNATAITAETTRATGAEGILQTNINTVQTNFINGIATEVTNRNAAITTAVAPIQTGITQNTADISTLNTGLTTEATTRASADVALQNQITGLNTINGVVVNQVNSNTVELTNHEARITGLEETSQQQAKDINKLQQTKLLMEQDIRFYDGKRFTFTAFNSYDVNANKGFSQGLRVALKATSSYEERLLKKQQDTLKEIQYASFELSKQVAQAKTELIHINNLTYSTVVIEKVVDRKGNVLKRRIISSGLHN